MNPRRIIIPLCLLLAACAPVLAYSEEATPAAALSFYLVTPAPNATATPTPFQPSYVEGSFVVLTTATLPPPMPTSPPAASPTLDPILLTPTPIILPTAIPTPLPLTDTSDLITFLLLGSDLRPGSSYRTDTIVMAFVRPNDGQVSLVSVPRDLWVNIPTVGMQRINTAYQYGELYGYAGGGPGLLKDTILYNLGVSIDHTAMVDFDGFRQIVNTLGGIDVPVACAYTDWHLIDPTYDPENENNWELYTVGPGVIHMDGDLALWYARSRQKSNDFDRGRRQQEVLRSIYTQGLSVNALTNLPQLWSDLNSTLRTDLGLGDLVPLTPLGLHLTNADIRSYYIAGDLVTSWITPGGAYVLLPNGDAIQAMLQQAIAPSAQAVERNAIKVEIQNGSPYDGWDALAAQRLNYAGYETSLMSADTRDHYVTLLYDLTTDQDPSRSGALLAVLGLPQSALISVPTANSATPYVLMLGSDYNSCFVPSQLSH
jgi:LCP family protein required for cell wall assembly